MFDITIPEPWLKYLAQQTLQPYYARLMSFLETQYAECTVYPSKNNVFRALELCPPEQVRVVIIGQDPYHGEGQAHGLSFSVPHGVRLPPSLRNIFKELQSEVGGTTCLTGSLEDWARQGVLLLNSVLTVRQSEAASHAGQGWEQFTDAVVASLSEHHSGIVYMLWGSYAQRKGAIVDESQNCVLRAVHPSPLSAHRGFFGCNHFIDANKYLISHDHQPICW